MHNLTLALEGAWKVLLAGLILGAGLPALFAVGIRSLAYGADGPARRPAGTVAGYACFALVLAGVLLGITFIVASGFGKQLSFDGVLPVVTDKK
ncbi:hypothetical protein Aph02nite_82520 [Actinoplanes philippinensis]|uniref:Uncharacterized protein n=1 Tax=Actinoplanes philippinensis TaxID=35752 RepID=A0A1I2MRQ9_9ACTN|nr:hypothetical protein [Actinoplanes philippinensis]GIE82302.1 hypothetical protein Aph02nite_82520 [Actinoplanes philippinensis]SFF92056.1 hypothetical protein SAMN05421541_13111 [Actinoplanes philippinensis]